MKNKTTNRHYTIRFRITDDDLLVLKKSLESYPKKKHITADLLGLIKYQEDRQDENT